MISSQQCRAARAGLDWTRDLLASKAGVSLSTIASFEREEREPFKPNLAALKATFEAAGVRFTNGGCVCFSDGTTSGTTE